MQWNDATFENANGNLQRIWNEISFEIHWKLHRKKNLDSYEKGLHQQRDHKGMEGGLVKKNLQVSIFYQFSANTIFPVCQIMEKWFP